MSTKFKIFDATTTKKAPRLSHGRRAQQGQGTSLTSLDVWESDLPPRARAIRTAMARGAAEDRRARRKARAALGGLSAYCLAKVKMMTYGLRSFASRAAKIMIPGGREGVVVRRGVADLEILAASFLASRRLPLVDL
jgi:hypothetical protein